MPLHGSLSVSTELAAVDDDGDNGDMGFAVSSFAFAASGMLLSNGSSLANVIDLPGSSSNFGFSSRFLHWQYLILWIY